jgi:hypothetical protein
MIMLADKGLARWEMERYADQVKVLLARPDRKDEARRFGNLGGMRQWIESVNDTLKCQLDLECHGGRTPAGVCVRVAQRLLAMAACIWHNWRTSADDKRSLSPMTTEPIRNHSSKEATPRTAEFRGSGCTSMTGRSSSDRRGTC